MIIIYSKFESKVNGKSSLWTIVGTRTDPFAKSTFYIKATHFLKSKVKNGFHKCLYNNGDRYEGFWRDDQRHGKGSMFLKTAIIM